MPRFYFHISNDEQLLQDRKGIVLDDLNAAAAYARRIVREIAETERVAVLVTDGRHRALMQISAPEP